jgi:PAS domain S-box-containing protein
MPMVVSDPRQPDNPIVLANKAFLDLTGYTAEEVIGRNCRFLQGEDTSATAIESIRDALREEREIDVELLNYRKDGSAFWNQLSLSPVHDDKGRLLYVFGSQIDVTELRKVQSLEASEFRLLKEVDHRARNVLAIVSGIVRLTRSQDSARYARAIQQRVQALADAHTLLAERGWQEAHLDAILRQQIGPFHPERVRIGGPDVRVSAFIVQPLALVIHELIDNAIIHGALSGPRGVIDVTWVNTAESGGFSLQWQESGGPRPQPQGAPGYGAAMLEAMIERQLRGRMRQQWSNDGVTIQISIPGSPMGQGLNGDAGGAVKDLTLLPIK